MDIFLTNFIKIAILLNPFAVLSVFMVLTSQKSSQERRAISLKTALTVFLAGLIVLFSGNMLLDLLGITLIQFKVGGGVILMACALSLVWGKGTAYAKDDADCSSISVVPLAIPMALGPGTVAGLIVIGSETPLTFSSSLINALSLVGGTAILTIVLSFGVNAERVLNKSAIAIITKLTGLLLSGISAGMILDGLDSCLK